MFDNFGSRLAGWYDRAVVPHVIRCACGAPAITALRTKVVPLAHGKVFEIGCGGGLNQPLYTVEGITSYSGIDPSAKGLEFARAAAAAKGWKADIRDGYGEAIPFDDASFDCVVCTFTLCSVSDQVGTLGELRRILKPGGSLLFAEHGLAPDAAVRRWQERIEPVWKRLAGGCHLTRPVTSSIEANGFRLVDGGRHYAPKTPRFAGWVEWGSAIKA